MRLSGWVEIAPRPDAMTPKVLAVVEPMLVMLGSEPDPECWVSWGDDPSMRWSVFAATDAGLAQVNARVNVPGEGPRAGGKLIRWPRAQVGDLAIEMQGGHRILSFTLEGQILRGTDESADAIAAFVLDMLAAIDGRPRVARQASAATGTGSTRVAPKPPRKKAVPQLEAPKGASS
jgi:hypothetical protein